MACDSGRDSTPVMQSYLSFFMPFTDGRLHLRESPPFVRFSIGALVVEVFTEPSWWLVSYATTAARRQNHAPAHHDHFTASDAKPIKFFNAVRRW